MNAGTLFRIRYSKDQAAYADVVRLEQELEKAGRFRRGRVESELDDARERCLKAGVDWERAPKPPRDLRVPDRSGRVRVGAPDARAPAGWKPEPPAGAKAPPLSLSGTLSFTSQAAAASRTPVSSPSSASYTGGGAGAAATAATAYGAADAGSFTTLAATEWLGSSPTPSYSDGAGNSWLEGPDGSLWFTDPTGAAYTVGADGNFFALSPDGMLYGQAPDGTSVTWAPDGTPLTMDDGGLLWATDTTQPMLYGEDGGFYAPDDAIGMVSYEDPLAGMLPGPADDGITGEDPAFDVAGGDELSVVEDPVYDEITIEEYTVEPDELYIDDDGFSDGAYAPEDLGGGGWTDVPDASLPEPEDGWRGLDDASWDA